MSRRGWVVAGVALLAGTAAAASLIAGGISSAQAPGSSGERTSVGASLYAEDCQSCHGPRGEGVTGIGPTIGAGETQGAGPSLRGVDAGTVDFYLTTGYMPLDDGRDVPKRNEPTYGPEQIEALVGYVTALGGGGRTTIPSVDPGRGEVSQGQEIFTESCAGCHQVLGEGGVVGQGVAPELRAATDTQVAEAVRSGPYLMPRFSERQISDRELDSLARYVDYTKDPDDEGGWGIGHIGPIPEGLAAWIVAAIVLVGVIRLIGRRMGPRGEESDG